MATGTISAKPQSMMLYHLLDLDVRVAGVFLWDIVPFNVTLLVDDDVARLEIAVGHGKCRAVSILPKHVVKEGLLVQAVLFK